MSYFHNFDLTQAWIEIENFYDYLRLTTISLFGLTISLWQLILSEYICCSLLDLFLFWRDRKDDDDD